jgi:hypothetical protein
LDLDKKAKINKNNAIDLKREDLMPFNRTKFKGLVHYVCYKGGKRKLGATKLNKILWYSDSIHYLHTGESITGETYKKEKFGPVSSHIVPVVKELEQSGLLECGTSKFHGYNKARYNCLEKPDTTFLNANQKKLVDQVTKIICKEHTAKSISELSHDRIWEAAETGEEIPLYAAFVWNIEKPDAAAREWALSVFSK